MPSDKHAILEIVDRLGWPIKRSRHGWKVYPPNGSRPIAIHRSKPTDHRAIHNYIAQFRRAGADI